MQVSAIKYVFEVSWEVCNKVGGIHTVLKTKIGSAVEHFRDNYFLIGPFLGNNPEFEETDEDLWNRIKPKLVERKLSFRCGRWNVAGRPRVVLVNHNNKYNQAKLLFQLWEEFNVDSITGTWDYIEPVLFSTAFGEVIEVLYEELAHENEVAVAQFHEWMSGAGLLYIKQQVPEIGTIFTTHATMLGRSMSSHGIDIYTDMENIVPLEMANRMNVMAKHSMGSVSARESDCFTTVSEITGKEAAAFFDKAPQVILPNGINISDIPDLNDKPGMIRKHRETILNFASKFLQKNVFSEKTKIIMISGRYEFHNKGIGLLLESLQKVNIALKETKSQDQVLVFVSVIGGNLGISQEILQSLKGANPVRTGISRICTHQLEDPQHDPIWNTCNRLNLLNTPEDGVNIIFMPVYLDGYDGLLNMNYYDVLSACDLGVFPSYYEPWGYTPLESAAHSVPTITTDLAGFGLWVEHNFDHNNKGVIILDYQAKPHGEVVEALSGHILNHLRWTKEEISEQKAQARKIAEKTDWKDFYSFYLQAYAMAAKTAIDRKYSLDTSAYTREIVFGVRDFVRPRFRAFSVIAELPKNLNRLWDIAYNLWWTWNPEFRELFSRIDPKMWAELSENPVELLMQVSPERLKELSGSETYLRAYNRAIGSFDYFLKDTTHPLEKEPLLTRDNPIAYFSTEFGLHESIPIYSGGLGILSGDHLKTASDLNIPLVGVGLLYKNGYLFQTIDKDGNQVTLYPENDFSRMPIRVCTDKKGDPIRVSVDLPGRKLYAQVWKIEVGRVTLYLLDSYVPENSKQDMELTSVLYSADQRLRIEQEILLGFGGFRFLEILDIKPSVYHFNEGHSAFLLLDRIRKLIKEEGLNFSEAREVVRASSVFTVHTPVEAGNENFDQALMKHYFSEYVRDIGIDWDTFWELGREAPGEAKPFLMSVLALKLCSSSNAVSKLHGEVSRKIWKNVWSGFEESEIPIPHITNGVHIQSWVSPEMKKLLETYIGIDWYAKSFDAVKWDKADEIPGAMLWETHEELKARMMDFLKKEMVYDWERQGVSQKIIQKKIEALDEDTLTIGFARRFVGYKRPLLVFSDIERLLQILHKKDFSVQIIFSGLAHPNDGEGKNIVKTIYSYSMDKRFMDKIFFVENYNIEIARYLVQGVDVWLNTPMRYREASGTSGMKAAANGVLNFSILDGWWAEGFNGDNGWAIGAGKEYNNMETQNLVDSQSIYDILEDIIAPLYYKRSNEGIPEEWVKMMKESIKNVIPAFNTHRMLKEYYEKVYLPVARRSGIVVASNYERAKALTDWKLKIGSRFSTVHVKWCKVKGFRDNYLKIGDTFGVEIGLDLGKLADNEVLVELVVGEPDEREFVKDPIIVALKKVAKNEAKGETLYSGEYQAIRSGRFIYGIRVLPWHPDMLRYQELGLVHWI